VGFERVRSLDEVMARADILSVHTPLTEETRGLVGARLLAQAKPGLIVVNTARGPIVDLDALADSLRSGRIGGAGLDVLPQEPADSGHPLIAAWLAGEPWVRWRLVLTPHAAFYSPDALEDMQRKSIEVCVAYLRDGTLMNCVNRQFLATGEARQAAPVAAAGA
jgi:D-3-phosphoglycerate dehydrogenase/C-terminal binding protein